MGAAYGELPSSIVLSLMAALGLAVGSFLNVVVHRVPAGLSVVRPGSACPGCDHPVRGFDNLPVVSWLMLRGRCRDCRSPISARYPLVEAGTAVAFLAVGSRFADPVVVVVALILAAAGLALALIDLDHGRLPFAITAVTGALVATVVVAASVSGHCPVGVGTLALGAGGWLAVYGGIWLLTAGRGMGFGDVALAPVLGLGTALAGTGATLVGLMAGFVLGGLIGGLLMVTGRIDRGTRVPHGPFLLAGAALGLFAGPQLSHAYLVLVGLA